MRNILLSITVVLLFASCNVKRNVSGKGIPKQVSHIEFWNGGSCIRSYDDVKISIRTYVSTGVIGKDISYYFYDITVDGKTESIVDSESLAIVFTE